ncbi:unnamed protein product, partial [Ectocarpus fasciculatus]
MITDDAEDWDGIFSAALADDRSISTSAYLGFALALAILVLLACLCLCCCMLCLSKKDSSRRRSSAVVRLEKMEEKTTVDDDGNDEFELPTKRMSEVKQQRRGSSFMNKIPFFGTSAKMNAGETDIEAGATRRVAEDHIFAYPPHSSGGDSGKTQDAADSSFPARLGAPSGNDFFYATRRFAEPQLNSPSPRTSTGALAAGAAGAAGAAATAAAGRRRPAGGAVAPAHAGDVSEEWPLPISATTVGAGASGSSGGPSSSTISAVSAGSMETKHDVESDARVSSLSPAGRAGSSGAIGTEDAADATATVTADAAGVTAAAVVGTGAAAGAAASKEQKRDDVSHLEDIEQERAEFGALQEEHEAKNKEISARGRMALADFLLGTSDMTSPTSASGRIGGALPTVMEEGSPRGAQAAFSDAGTSSQVAEGSQVGSQVSSSAEGTVIVQVEPAGSVDSAPSSVAGEPTTTSSASEPATTTAGLTTGARPGVAAAAAAGAGAGAATAAVFSSNVRARQNRPMLATDRSESSGSEQSAPSPGGPLQQQQQQQQQHTTPRPPALMAAGSGSMSYSMGSSGHPTSTRSSTSSPGSNLIGVSLISSTPSTDSILEPSPESSPRRRRTSPMPPLPPVKEASQEWASSSGTAGTAAAGTVAAT